SFPTRRSSDLFSMRRSNLLSAGTLPFYVLAFFTLIFTLTGCGSVSGSSSMPTPSPTASPTPSASPSPSPSPNPSASPTPTPSPSPTVANDKTLHTEDVATGLDNPWSLAFAPDGRLFFTEPPGRPRVIYSTGLVAAPVLYIHSPIPSFEVVLPGMDLDPAFGLTVIIYSLFLANLVV